MKVGDMVALNPQYDNTELFESFGSAVPIGALEQGVLCLVLEIRGNLMAKILVPSGRVGWLPIGWLVRANKEAPLCDTEKTK